MDRDYWVDESVSGDGWVVGYLGVIVARFTHQRDAIDFAAWANVRLRKSEDRP